MENTKVALITGCSSGIGRELSSLLAEKGYEVIATARDEKALKDLPVSLKLPLDVTDKESVTQAVNEVISNYQRIDVLINNAGYSVRGAMETMEKQSVKWMTNPSSRYESLYRKDAKHKENQTYTQAKKAAEIICKILDKEYLKSRYEVAVPYAYSMFAHFPYSLRDYLMMNSR